MQRAGRDIASLVAGADSDDKKEDKIRRGAPHGGTVSHHQGLGPVRGQGKSTARTAGLVLVVFFVLQAGLWLTWGHFPPGTGVKTRKCEVIAREYAIRVRADARQLPPGVRATWDLLDCDAWSAAGLPPRADGHAPPGSREEALADDAGAEVPAGTCPAPCTDSWSFGEWVQWCPPYARRTTACGYNFVLPEQKCMFHWFDRRETAVCMKNNWLMLLGSSGAMNLGLTWLMALDPKGTRSPFYGPRWYNKTCWHNRSVPCEKSWEKPKDLSFVNFQSMAYDLVMDQHGGVVYKASSKFDGKDLPHLWQAPPVPPGGWRLTVLPTQYAHEVVSKVQKGLEHWNGSAPMVYAQVGQWYLNAFDGRSRIWGLNTSEVAALERLRDPRQLFEVYYDDVIWMVESLQQLNVQAIALGTMPVSKHRCRKRDGLGCRKGLNSMIDLVLEHETAKAAEAGEGKLAPVFAVDWASTSIGEQGGAHTDHKAGLLGIQRFLSVICPSLQEMRNEIAAQSAGEGSDPAAEVGDEPCARAGIFTRSCGPDNDWRVMIGRRCNVTTLDMTPAHVQELINDAQSMPAQVPTEGLRIEPALVSLHVEYKVHDDPMSDRVLALRQYALLIFSVLVLCGTATNGPWLPAPCCEWLHGAPGETCWAALHEGIGQVDDTVRVLCSSVPCVHHCLGGCTDGKGESGCGRDARDANHSQLECGESGMVRSIEAEASKSHNGACKGKDGDDDFQERDEPKANGQGAAHASADSSAAKKGARPKLDAITGARLLASLHVAATHLSRLKPPAAPPIYILGWGFTWVPWFFMLSGYILAYARLSQPKRDGKSGPSGGSHLSPLAFCHRRLASVYPLYLLGVCISLLTLADRGKLFTVRPSALLSQVFLLQAWLPSETEHALQSQCWFLSAIVPFWLLHQSIVTFVDRLPTRAIFKLLMLISLVPWILLVLLPPLMGVPHEWYTLHKWKAFKNWVDVAVVALKFHPACYVHIYVFGVALAAWYLRIQKSGERAPWVARHGAILGYLSLFLVFACPALQPPAHKLLCRLGGLAPLQGLLLVGLSEGRDPVAKLLQNKLLARVGAWSFGVYILHFEVLALWGGAESGKGVGLAYWVVLLAMAALAHHYVQVPWGTDLRLSACVRAAALGVMLASIALSSVPDYVRSALLAPATRTRNPAAIVYRHGAVDFRLNLRIPAEDHELAFVDWFNGGNEHVIMNPSLAQDPADPSSIWIAARVHRKDSEKHFLPSEALGFRPPGPAADAKGLVSKSVDGDALGHAPPNKHSAKESVGGKGPTGATRKLLYRAIPGSSPPAKVGEAKGGSNNNVSVTILKWNSRVAVGVMDLKGLTVGAEAELHPVFVPLPPHWRGKDATAEHPDAQHADADMPRSSRQLTAARNLLGADHARERASEEHSEDGAELDQAAGTSLRQAVLNLEAVDSITRREWGALSSMHRKLLSTDEIVPASRGSGASVVLSRSSRSGASGETGAQSDARLDRNLNAKSRVGSGDSTKVSDQEVGSEGKAAGGSHEGGGAWIPCMPPPVRNEANNTATLSFSTGPEDPRLQFSEIDGALRISVFSYVPGADSVTDIPKPCSDRTSYGRMFEVTVSAESQGMQTKELFYDDLERSPIEKNWMRFEHKGVVHYIRSLHPFVVLTASKSQQTALKVVVRTEVAPFRQASESRLAVHGGSNPVLIKKSASPAEHLGGAKYASYYLGTFHTRDSKGRYRNYAFAFQAAKPFSILGISRQLPLLETGGHMNAFLSGLFVAPDTSTRLFETNAGFAYPADSTTVFFSYGAGDQESRVLKVPLEQVERWLFPQGQPQARQTQRPIKRGQVLLKGAADAKTNQAETSSAQQHAQTSPAASQFASVATSIPMQPSGVSDETGNPNARVLVPPDQLPGPSDRRSEKMDQPQFSGWNVFAGA